ncbi:STAS domain-containing protein [Streptomyces sp. NPDC046831]|uniref:STAS domain-containing protein n=1 Tax=Streptomyces sp. NPDC046831 TaxID=3154805 RepID=UPI0033F031BC
MAEPDQHILRITPTADPPGLRLEGELDATRHGAVLDALSRVADGTGEAGEVRLDLAGLHFVDLGALSALTRFVQARGGGLRIVLDHLPPATDTLVGTVGWERLPGLVQGRKEDA